MLIASTLSSKNALYRIHCVFLQHSHVWYVHMYGRYELLHMWYEYIWHVSIHYFSEFKLHVDLSKIKKDVLTSFSTP